MGLDNGFQLKHKKKDDNNASSVGRSIEIPFEIAYFRKYFELDKWCMHHCKHIRDDEVQITKDDLNKLWNTIEPIVKVLRALGDNKVLYYDENGYPKKYAMQFCGNDFDPTNSQSYAAGIKLLHLADCIGCMMDILEYNGDEEKSIAEITFYSSW